MPDPGHLTDSLGAAVDRIVAAGEKVQQNAKDAAAQAAPQRPGNGPGRPEGPAVTESPTSSGETR